MTIGDTSSISSVINRQINNSSQKVKSSLEQISSGRRINKASDDPAGLALALNLMAGADTNNVAARNISDGVSLASVADGALQQAGDITTRMAELSTQAANGTLSQSQRSSLDQEYQSLRQEMDRISATTQFNGMSLLNGSNPISLQVGNDSSENSRISLNRTSLSSQSLGLPQSIATQEDATAGLDQIKQAAKQVDQARTDIGAVVNRLGQSLENAKTTELGEREAAGRIMDVDLADQTSKLIASQISQRAAAAVSAQANLQPEIALKLLS